MSPRASRTGRPAISASPPPHRRRPSSAPPPTPPQVKYILGLKLPRSDTIQKALNDIFSNLNQFKWREFCMG